MREKEKNCVEHVALTTTKMDDDSICVENLKMVDLLKNSGNRKFENSTMGCT